MKTKTIPKFFAVLIAAIVAGMGLASSPAAATPELEIDITVILEGATRSGQSAMSTDLGDRGLIPSTDPYGFGQTYTGLTNAVDWVEIELRSEANLSVVAEGAAILLSDGSVVAGDGTLFRLQALPNKDYHIIVRHRNHIPEQSPPVDPQANKLTFDFTTNTQAPYGAPAEWHVDLNGDGLFGAIPANGDQSSTLELRWISSGGDKALWQAENGLFGQYLTADYNMDGQVSGADKVVWSQAYNLIVFVPVP